jgi:hypothetical protein
VFEGVKAVYALDRAASVIDYGINTTILFEVQNIFTNIVKVPLLKVSGLHAIQIKKLTR